MAGGYFNTGSETHSSPTKRTQGNIDVKHSLKSLNPGVEGRQVRPASLLHEFFVIPFVLNFLHGCLVILLLFFCYYLAQYVS
jgi:hypothetical protein